MARDAAAQVADPLKDFVAGKEEGGEQAPYLRVVHGRVFVGDLFEHSLVVVKHVVLLIVVSDMNIGPQAYHTFVGGYHLIEDAEDRRLSGAVVADQSYMFSSADLEGDP